MSTRPLECGSCGLDHPSSKPCPKPKTHKHRFTAIAPEYPYPDAKIWQWCIRCGTLKLGSEKFSPGAHQKATIIAD